MSMRMWESDSTMFPGTREGTTILRPEVPRTPGLHLSDVLNYIQQATNPAPKGDFSNYMEMGFAWERMLEHALRDNAIDASQVVRVGEVESDGILMMPDGMDVAGWVLEEWKATYKSMNKITNSTGEIDPDAFQTDPGFWRWFAQIKSYCRAMDTLRARIRVFFVNGNYKGSGPLDRVVEMEWTDRELDENWDMVLRNARSLRGTQCMNE